MRSLCLVVTLWLFSTLAAFPQTTDANGPEGVIGGTVLDEQGQPIKGAQVCTMVTQASSRGTRSKCSAATDAAGQFQIDHVAMGATGVAAGKAEDGYVTYYGTGAGTETVTLTPEQPSAQVVLKFGPRQAILVPSVKDKFTGKPITEFSISWTIIDPDEPNRASSGSAGISRWTTHTVLPAEKYLVLGISARGYKRWHYSDPSDPSRPGLLLLQSGERREMAVELEPQAAEPAAR